MVWVSYPTSCTHQSLYSNMMKSTRWEVNIWPLVLKAQITKLNNKNSNLNIDSSSFDLELN